MASKAEIIAHDGITPSTTVAYKIYGRWYWITEVEEPMEGGSRFAMTVPVARDPRYAKLGKGKLRYIGSYSTVLMRAQVAPVFDWVTKQIEERDKLAAFKRGELDLTHDEYVALSIRVGF